MGDRVEFLDSPASDAGGEDVLETGDGRGPSGRLGAVVAGLVVLAVVAAVLVGRLVGGDGPAATPTAGAVPSGIGRPAPPVTKPVFGLIGLPPVIGTPRDLVSTRTGDVVWMLDRGAGIVRVENGTVTATQLLESQATAIAVDPGGDRLYVATAAGRPTLQVLDATTLTPGVSRPLEGSIQALAVSTDAVWAASGSQLFRLDLQTLRPFAVIALPGVVLTSHLRVDDEQADGGGQVITGLATGGAGNSPTTTRFLRVDPLTQAVSFGPVLPNDVQVATGQLLTWVSYQPPGEPSPFTAGYASVLAGPPDAVAAPPLATGSRIYDGGGGYSAFLVVAPDSSVVGCRDPGGFPRSEVDVAPALPDAVITGQVLRTDTAFYLVTDRGLVRSGVGACT